MGRSRYVHNPRAIIQRRRTKQSKRDTLTVTIPRKIVQNWNVQAGQIVELSTLVEGQETFLKVRKVLQ